jgi:lipopolysaccharide transport system ATP-binding protein
MSEPIIKVEGLGKKYIISHEGKESYTALRDVISRKAKNMAGFQKEQKSKEEFWALKDVSFEVNQGDAVGIIGRNGAGKSTLLKILSRITEPSKGRIEINGRIASLLEVGTGFHPELTGRENIFLNGAILGMSRVEIKRKFDEIVDFSGVEKFLDTPVKRYSSGMYVRLAFAVAAHLEPEILVVDEVLAVGDAEFQKKCLGKMSDVSKNEGRTVLFVSHQLSAISNLCNRGICLASGQVIYNGDVKTAINKYLESNREINTNSYSNDSNVNPEIFFTKILCVKNAIDVGGDLSIDVDFNDKYLDKELVININIYDFAGDLMAHVINDDDSFSSKNQQKGRLSVNLKNINLPPGKYFLSFWVGYGHSVQIEALERILSFEVSGQEVFIKRTTPYPSHGKLVLQSEWTGN